MGSTVHHPVHCPPWAGYFRQSVHQPNRTASVSRTGAVRFLTTVLLKIPAMAVLDAAER